MHLLDGVIDSGAILLGGAALGGLGVAIGLRQMDDERIPQTGVVAAAFFVASLIHVPLGPTSVHLGLVGLAGLLLGWAVFPAVLVGLFLQAVLFGMGGWTTLGLNTLTFAVPATVCYYVFGRAAACRELSRPWIFALGFAAGVLGMLLSCLSFVGFLLLAGEEFLLAAYGVLFFHLPVLFVEGIVTGTILLSLKRMRPEVFDAAGLSVAKECPHV